MEFDTKLKNLTKELKIICSKKKKLSGFMIGSTSKPEKAKYYFTPIRETNQMILGGIIVYSEHYAKKTAKYLDGKIDYVLVDAEKKIPPKKNGTPSNIERRVKEIIKKSRIWPFKGNDLTVDAVDIFLTHLLKDKLKGVGGKKILIIGAGNIGFKLSLLMLERGAKIYLCAKSQKKLIIKSKSINLIKPKDTVEKVTPINVKNLENILDKIDILIGATNGKAVVNLKLVRKLKHKPILIDLGKGNFSEEAINFLKKENIIVFRTDIAPALQGFVNKMLMLDSNKRVNLNRKKIYNCSVISSGVLGSYGEIVLDNVNKPKKIFGVCDGKGDFIRSLNLFQKKQMSLIKKYIGQK